jgi:hypothetical protein
MALIPRAYRISPSRTWTLLKSYRLSTERMASRAYTLVLQATGGEMGSSLVTAASPEPRDASNGSSPPSTEGQSIPHNKVLARLRQRSEFRTLLRALSLLERNRQLLTHHPPRSCALRRALPTLPLCGTGHGGMKGRRWGERRQPFARTARRRTRHCGGGIRKGSLCVSGFRRAIYGRSAKEVRFFLQATHAGCFMWVLLSPGAKLC